MKSIEISQATKPLADYARQVAQGAVVVMKRGKPLAILSSARGMDSESIALANNAKFVAIIKRSRRRQQAEGGVSLEQARRRLRLAAKTRTKRDKAR